MAATTSIVQVRMNTEMKKATEHMLKSMGLNMSTAVNLLCKQILVQKKLPFEVIAAPNAVTEKALDDIDRGIVGQKQHVVLRIGARQHDKLQDRR